MLLDLGDDALLANSLERYEDYNTALAWKTGFHPIRGAQHTAPQKVEVGGGRPYVLRLLILVAVRWTNRSGSFDATKSKIWAVMPGT